MYQNNSHDTLFNGMNLIRFKGKKVVIRSNYRPSSTMFLAAVVSEL